MRISRVLLSLFRDDAPSRRLIVILLTCCVLLMFIPNFNVLPDRRIFLRPLQPCRKPAVIMTSFSHHTSLRFKPPKQRCRWGESLEIRIDEDLKLFTSWPYIESELNRPICKYQSIHASRDSLGYDMGAWSDWFTHSVELPKETDYFHLICVANKTDLVSDEFIALAPARVSVSSKLSQQNGTQQVWPGNYKSKLNLLIVTMDGLARIDFIRTLGDTYKFLVDDLKSVDMKYHSQVGASRRDNILPLLTGKPGDEIVNEWKLTGREVSEPNVLLFNKFGRKGYLTLSTEDDPTHGTMPDLMKWFSLSGIHYNTLPLLRAFQSNNALPETRKPCLHVEASRENFQLGYVLNFFKQSLFRPLFSYVHFSGLNLTNLYDTRRLDTELIHFLQKFFESGHLNSTVIIMTSGDVHQNDSASDSGLLKTPFAYLTLPQGLAADTPDVINHLRQNAYTLTTNYDLYKTIVDLFHLHDHDATSRDAPDKSVGQSLLTEIHPYRECKSLLVPEEFCACL